MIDDSRMAMEIAQAHHPCRPHLTTNRTMNLRHLLLLLIVLILPQQATAWGREGHIIVAEIASTYLSEETNTKVQRLLNLEPDPKDRTLAYASLWPDLIKSSKHPEHKKYRFARRLHYVNLPKGKDCYVKARDCPDGNCVVEAIKKYTAILKDSEDHQARLVALKFLVHFVGDIHQPLHVGYAHDRGGNDVSVEFFNQKTNLHRVWDTMILRQDKASAKRLKAYAVRLAHGVSKEEYQKWLKISEPEGWTTEARQYLDYPVYQRPRDRKLSEDYQRACLPVVKLQLQRAGVRLAALLNRRLAPTVKNDDEDV